ncbi:MAG: hypothetical protein HY796_02635 [Elusimicrobia bacterium]|nr:hypothetical protein [Elusimicrobiota bacterium]
MTENKNSRKKALIIFVLAFLACGGGIFIFFVFQGLGDFNSGSKSNFHYGFSAKNALIPLISYFSRTDSEAELVKQTKNRLEARGLDVSLLDGSRADVSDWMDKSGGAGGSSGNAVARSASAAKTAVPRMGGGLGDISGGGGGGSQTSAALAQFSGPGGAGSTRISGAKAGQSAAAPGKGAMGALALTRAAMKEGIRSGSAMTAKAKWDQGFGVGAAGKAAGGALAYAKPGLANLDRIKKGDIADLKTLEPGSLTAAIPPPVEDKSGSDPLANKVKGKDGGDAAADAAKLMAQNAAGAVGSAINKGGGGGPKINANAGMPPPDVIGKAVDKFCPNSCDPGDGSTYTDKQITYEKQPDGTYNATYEGTHDDQPYKDTVNIDLSKGPDDQVTPVGSCTPVANECTPTEFGTNTPIVGP